jgi:Ca-activated chloride channel family protein
VSFTTPLVLLALLALPLLLGLYILAQRRRRAYAVRFTNLALLGQVAGPGPGVRRHLPAAFFLLGVGGLLAGMAGPVAVLRLPRDQASVMIVIDVSGSMKATDVQPSRLEAARAAARSLIDELPGSAQVGLVSFNTAATLLVALTQDRSSVETALDGLHANGGTAIGDGIEAALDELSRHAAAPRPGQHPWMIVLLTDGSSNAGVDPQQAASDAHAAGVPVETVGVGQRGAGTATVQGQLIDGVDEQTLQQVAATTGGHYHYAQEAGQLQQIYGSLGSQFGWRTERVDLTLPALGLAAVVLVAGALLSLRWFRLLP